MITKELVDRINELASKKKTVGLTPEEQTEQKECYRIYLASIRHQLTTQLEAAGLAPQTHVCSEGCDCHHKH